MSENQNPEGETPEEYMKRLQGDNDASPAGWGAPPPPPNPQAGPTPPPPPAYGQDPNAPYGSGYNQAYGSGYGNAPQNFGQPGAMGKQDHPQTVTILVLGIVSLLCCSLLGPVVWWMGNNARKESQNNPALNENNTTLTIGWILGIVATGLLVLGVLFYALGITSSLVGA